MSQPRETPSSITAWFRPENQTDIDDSDKILKAAFERALKFYKEQAKKNDLPSFQSSTMESVLAEVGKAEEQCAKKRSTRGRISRAMSSGWTTTVNKINTFSTVIDVLVSTHPEYAAPVWGTIKFLFLVTLNHQELASKISDAFTAISEALPEVDFLASQLYPVPRIQSTLATMYTHIIDFCIRALKWYRKASSFFRKTFAAIKDPWTLEFDEVVSQIQRTTLRIREQAAVAHQAETRHVSTMVCEVRREVLKMRDERNLSAVQASPGVLLGSPTLSPLSKPSILGKAPLVLKEMAKYFLTVPFNPSEALILGAAVRDRRRVRGSPVSDQVWTSAKLRNWISQLGSALVQLQGSFITADASRDFALDMVELAKATGLPLAWYVGSRLPSTPLMDPMTVTQIWRSFVWQILEENTDSTSYRNLVESDFSSCSTEDDWIALLVAVLAEMPRVILVVDCHKEEHQIRDTVGKFWRIYREQKAKTTVKMLLLSYSSPRASMPVMLPDDGVAFYSVSLDQDRKPGTARASMQGNLRGRRQVAARRGGGASQLRPFMLKLLEQRDQAADKL
ncbi:hypothetical protein ACJ41O_000641 [Fusarium nematophilum]